MSFDARLVDGLTVLAAVVEGGNFVRAAQALGLTTSGVSRAISRLESRLDVRLFHRTPRGNLLTDEARHLYAEVRPLLDGLEVAAERAARARLGVRGRLRIHADPAFASYVLTPYLPVFLGQHPDLRVEVLTKHELDETDDFDVAVRFGEPAASSLVCRKLFDSRVLTCASPAYLARHGTPQHPSDLVDHECLSFRDPLTGRPFAWELRRGDEVFPVECAGRLLVDDARSATEIAIAGFCITQPLEVISRAAIAEGRIVQILADWSDELFPAYAYHRSRTSPSARVRSFLDFIVAISAQTSTPPPSTVTTEPVVKPLRMRNR